jgi:hypothetical protein
MAERVARAKRVPKWETYFARRYPTKIPWVEYTEGEMLTLWPIDAVTDGTRTGDVYRITTAARIGYYECGVDLLRDLLAGKPPSMEILLTILKFVALEVVETGSVNSLLMFSANIRKAYRKHGQLPMNADYEFRKLNSDAKMYLARGHNPHSAPPPCVSDLVRMNPRMRVQAMIWFNSGARYHHANLIMNKELRIRKFLLIEGVDNYVSSEHLSGCDEWDEGEIRTDLLGNRPFLQNASVEARKRMELRLVVLADKNSHYVQRDISMRCGCCPAWENEEIRRVDDCCLFCNDEHWQELVKILLRPPEEKLLPDIDKIIAEMRLTRHSSHVGMMQAIDQFVEDFCTFMNNQELEIDPAVMVSRARVTVFFGWSRDSEQPEKYSRTAPFWRGKITRFPVTGILANLTPPRGNLPDVMSYTQSTGRAGAFADTVFRNREANMQDELEVEEWADDILGQKDAGRVVVPRDLAVKVAKLAKVGATESRNEKKAVNRDTIDRIGEYYDSRLEKQREKAKVIKNQSKLVKSDKSGQGTGRDESEKADGGLGKSKSRSRSRGSRGTLSSNSRRSGGFFESIMK